MESNAPETLWATSYTKGVRTIIAFAVLCQYIQPYGATGEVKSSEVRKTTPKSLNTDSLQ